MLRKTYLDTTYYSLSALQITTSLSIASVAISCASAVNNARTHPWQFRRTFTSSSFSQGGGGIAVIKRSHSDSLQDGLIIALIALLSLFIVALLGWFVVYRRKRSLHRRRSTDGAPPMIVGSVSRASLVSPIVPQTDAAPRVQSSSIVDTIHDHPFNVRQRASPPAALKAKARRKPAPLDLGPAKALPSPPNEETNTDLLAPAQSISYHPETILGAAPPSQSKTASSFRPSLTLPDEKSTIMFAVAAHSRLFQPGSSSSPPITPVGKARARNRSASTSAMEERQWPDRRDRLSTIQSTTLTPFTRPDSSPESGPIRYRSAFQLPISATPPNLPTTPLSELPSAGQREAALQLTNATTLAVPASTPLTLADPKRFLPTGSASPALCKILIAKRNSFGVKEEAARTSMAPSASIATPEQQALAQQLEGKQSATASPRLSGKGKARDEDGKALSSSGSGSGGSSSNTSRRQSRAWRLAGSRRHTTSSLSLRSSVQRALQVEPSSSRGYTFI
jgi:hypothetical protein